MHSVNPYPPLTSAVDPCSFKNSSNLLFKSCVRVSPPDITTFTEASPFLEKLFLSNASYNVGTPAINVGLCFLIMMIIIYCDTEMIIEYLPMTNVLLMKFK